MAKSAGDIFFKVESLMQDIGNSRWERTYTAGSQTDPSLLEMLTTAMDALLEVKPQAFASTGNIEFSTAGVRQSLPSTAKLLLDLTRNMGSDGSTAGDKITPIPNRSTLDALDPDWYSAELETDTGILHYVYRPEVDPRTVWVYPGVPSGGWYVEGTTADYPGSITDADTELEVFSTDFWALVYHVMYQAFAGDHKEANADWANAYFNKFLTFAGATGGE